MLSPPVSGFVSGGVIAGAAGFGCKAAKSGDCGAVAGF